VKVFSEEMFCRDIEISKPRVLITKIENLFWMILTGSSVLRDTDYHWFHFSQWLGIALVLQEDSKQFATSIEAIETKPKP
jgi:hypothetical protein